MAKKFSLNIIADRELHNVSKMLFGIFLEDINFSCDGGLNANMVNNSRFDGIYLSRKGYSELKAFIFKTDPHSEIDRLRYWGLFGGTMESCHNDPVAENSWYARIQVDEKGRLENFGYNGGKRNSQACAMSISKGKTYEFSCWGRSQNYQGNITISVTDGNGEALTDTAQLTPSRSWEEITLTLFGRQTGYGKLVLEFMGKGTVDLDGISLMPVDTWGKSDPRWSQGKLRRDLVEVLRDLKPKFLRFPGAASLKAMVLGTNTTGKIR